jgi:NAD(P)-dependent dehydrogenase (short-subunit alcohol dehydrogenase family)
VGGSRGIGRAVAELLCNLDAGVVVNGRDGGAVAETVAAITASGGLAAPVVGAANGERVAAALIDECLSRFGRLDTLVNCAESPSLPAPQSLISRRRNSAA